MTFVAPESAHSPTSRVPSIAIVGTDALLAALPATPVQLAHACMLAGYHSVVPASWGDELIAAATLRALDGVRPLPAIQCTCPFVAHRLLASGADLQPFLISFVAPPVATARYLRALHAPARLRITYVGRCPSAADESIDARLTPEELLAMFTDRDIVLSEQPRVFDSVIPPDRRRHYSQPGGLPASQMPRAAGPQSGGARRTLVELHGEELSVELAQHLLAGQPVLIDAAGKLGCVCSGATAGVDVHEMRAAITALEPPRAPSAVIDESIVVPLEVPLPVSPRSAIDVVSPPTTGSAPVMARGASARDSELLRSNGTPGEHDEASPAHATAATETEVPPAMSARRHSPARGIGRTMAGSLPTARDQNGRQLPRTYVARRRSPVRPGRAQAAEAPRAAPAARSAQAAPAATTAAEPVPSASRPAEEAESAVTTEPTAATEPTEPMETAAHRAPPAALGGDDAPTRTTQARGSIGPLVAPAPSESTEPVPPSRPTAPLPRGEEGGEAARYRERAVQLPITPRSDAPRRDSSATTQPASGERPLAQLLVFALLISTIVLVSAAVGVVVGRWMGQR